MILIEGPRRHRGWRLMEPVRELDEQRRPFIAIINELEVFDHFRQLHRHLRHGFAPSFGESELRIARGIESRSRGDSAPTVAREETLRRLFAKQIFVNVLTIT